MRGARPGAARATAALARATCPLSRAETHRAWVGGENVERGSSNLMGFGPGRSGPSAALAGRCQWLGCWGARKNSYKFAAAVPGVSEPGNPADFLINSKDSSGPGRGAGQIVSADLTVLRPWRWDEAVCAAPSCKLSLTMARPVLRQGPSGLGSAARRGLRGPTEAASWHGWPARDIGVSALARVP